MHRMNKKRSKKSRRGLPTLPTCNDVMPFLSCYLGQSFESDLESYEQSFSFDSTYYESTVEGTLSTLNSNPTSQWESDISVDGVEDDHEDISSYTPAKLAEAEKRSLTPQFQSAGSNDLDELFTTFPQDSESTQSDEYKQRWTTPPRKSKPAAGKKSPISVMIERMDSMSSLVTITEAVTSIQALFRGSLVRKSVLIAMNQKTPTVTIDSLYHQHVNESKIEFEAKKSSSWDTHDRAVYPMQSLSKVSSLPNRRMPLSTLVRALNDDQVAILIQATFRGYSTRNGHSGVQQLMTAR